MEKIQFAVSAKTARLIGRENISGVDGAVIELIKNAYDADATCVFVQFNIPFPAVPQSISFTLATTVLAPTNLPHFCGSIRTMESTMRKEKTFLF